MKSDAGLFFDFDGVLADTFDICYEIIKGLDPLLTHQEYRDRFLGNINDNKVKRKIEVEKRTRGDFDFFALYAPKLLQKEIIPETRSVVLALSEKYPLFIVSSTTTDPIRKFLEQEKLAHCFKEIYGNDVHKSKVQKITMLLEKYALDPARCLFITDTLGDIREGQECGVRSIAVSWGFHSKETLREGNPVAILDSIGTLPERVDYFLAPL